MTPLLMMRADLDMIALARWSGARGLTGDEGYALHCLLTETLGEVAPKPFRLMVATGGARATLFGYVASAWETLREAARTFGDPGAIAAIPPDSILTKPMPEDLPSGRRLGFDIRIRPVASLARGRTSMPDCRAGAERDVFQLEAERTPEDGRPRDREAVYADWFGRKLGEAATLETARMTSFQRSRVARKGGRPGGEGPDAVLRGVLGVADPAAFQALLRRGVGRHRSFGYGMLLLRPPGAPGHA